MSLPSVRPAVVTLTSRARRPVIVLISAALLLIAAFWSGSPAGAAEATVGLGSARSFAVLAGAAITNTGPSVVSGDLGLSPGSSVTGFPPGTVIDGAPHVADGVASLAAADLTVAYVDAAGRSTVTDVTGTDLGGRTLTAGVTEHTSAMQLTGTLTLDAQGDPDAVFIFKAGTSLVTASNSTVALINGASPCHVFWQVGSSATLGTDTTFVGTIMALSSATLATGASVQGRVLARNGTVTLDTNVITRPACAPVVTPVPTASAPTGSPTPEASESPTVLPSASAAPTSAPTTGPSPTRAPSSSPTSSPTVGSPSGTPTSGSPSGTPTPGNPSGNPSGPGTPTTPIPGGPEGPERPDGPDRPVVPSGHPETGLGGDRPSDHGRLALVLAGAALVVGGAAASQRRPPRRSDDSSR